MAYYQCPESTEKSVTVSTRVWVNYSHSNPSNHSANVIIFVNGSQVAYNGGSGSGYWASYTLKL